MICGLTHSEVLRWLKEEEPKRLRELYQQADAIRHENVGDEVHFRGLVEISSHCVRRCGYCGLRADNRAIDRYRMSADEIVACARKAKEFGYGTVVLQAGEDPGLTADLISALVSRIKRETELAVTLSLGERTPAELARYREAGADRYLLRFETSDPALFASIHPPRPGVAVDRVAQLRAMRDLGFEIGSGVMVGIPGQTYASLANDVLLFAELDLDMVGIGPYLPHPATPLATAERTHPEQAPNTEEMTYKMVALTRLACPQANIPSTTAIATLNRHRGRERALRSGANIVMPNLTPLEYRTRYEIYPGKACLNETADVCHGCLMDRVAGIGRTRGKGPGGRRRGGR